MKKKITFFLIWGLIAHSSIYAQATYSELENNKIVYPSPTAGSLGKYGEYPVSLYNGLVNIGQDIVTVKSGHLLLDVSLSYHASGNKPSDIPGWVGLGFSLNAGGAITRVIKDLPDDYLGGFYYSNDAVKYLWNNYPNSGFVSQYFSNQNDPRSDVYQFNFCGKTGEFVFDWDRNIHFKQKVPFKIEVIPDLVDGFGGFKVTTDDGTIYTFDQKERSIRNLAQGVTSSPPTSWYLTKIENLSGDNIVLKYTAPANKYRYKQYGSRKEVSGTFYDPGTPGDFLITSPTVTLNTSIDEVVYLDEIDFSNGKLLFGKSTRQDPTYVPAGLNAANAEEKKLDQITLKDNNDNVVKNWNFGYFENSTERLKLKSLTAQANDQTDVQKYSFEYDVLALPLPLPGPNPVDPYFCNDVDYWGYYNAAINGDNKIPKMYSSDFNQYFGSADREISPGTFAKAEMLEKITYPTGGYTQFTYEANDYSGQGASFAADQNPLTTTTGAGVEGYTFLYDRDNGGFEEDPATLSFTITKPTHLNISYACGADGPMHAFAAIPGQTYSYDYTAAPGTYSVQTLLNTDQLLLPSNADVTKAHGTVTVYSKEGDEIPIYAKMGPGMRIKSIENNDGITTTKRSFEYKVAENSPVSSGFLSVFPAFYASLQKIASNIFGVYLTSDPINDIGEGAPVGYSRVVERLQDNSYIEHNYTTYADHPDETMPFTNPFSDPKLAHMSSNDFWRGLETSTGYYNSAGVIQKRISNQYDVLPGSLTDVQAIELKPTISIADGSSSPNSVNGTLESIYYVHSCFLYNGTRTEEVFDKNGFNPITTTVNKYYNNVTHLQPTRVETSASDGAVITTATSFPDDFAPGEPFIDYMQANHLTSYPIEQVVYRQRGQVTNIVSGNIITYKTGGAGLPAQLLKLELANPVPQTSFKFSNLQTGVLPPSSPLGQFNADTRYQPAVTYTSYDNKGNLLESTRRDGITTAYLWGYNQGFPVAEVVGSGYGTASNLVTQSILDNAVGGTDDGTVRSALAPLRGITGALATTYTYKPLVGMTSQTDPAGRSAYYEYDNFGRTYLVRDQDNNILKRYCYSYSGQSGACPASTPTPACDVAACSATEGHKCINGNCEMGTRVNTLSILVTGNGTIVITDGHPYASYPGDVWSCIYHYTWSDNTVSGDYDEPASGPCSSNIRIIYREIVGGPGCNPTTCAVEGNACINGICEAGVKVYDYSLRSMINGGWQYYCSYHYEWSDGSQSDEYTQPSAEDCTELGDPSEILTPRSCAALGPDHKAVDGICEIGVEIGLGSNGSSYFYCYEWSDGSVSPTYSRPNGGGPGN